MKLKFFIQLEEGLNMNYDAQFFIYCWLNIVFFVLKFSYGDISSSTLFKDMDKLFYGGFLMFIYMEIVLSKFSWIELRVTG